MVVDNQRKKRWKKNFQRLKKNAASLGQQADEQIEKFLIRRFDRLISVKRFIFLWTTLFVMLLFVTLLQLRALGPYYQVLKPVPGGIFSEGIIGNFTNANP